MKSKPLILLAVAGGFGLVAMFGVMQVLNGQGQGGEPTVKVLIATADIPAGVPLDEKNVAFKDVPRSAAPVGAVTKLEDAVGKPLIARAVPEEIILEAKLGGADSIRASHQIPKGMRVATVSVDATKSHSGLLRPTDRVDVICAYKVTEPDRRQSTHVKTVLDYIEVFAVDNVRAGREGEVDVAVKNVSLLVTPEQFQLLKAAEEVGDLDLSLRNRDDKEAAEIAELSDSVFFGAQTSQGDRHDVARPPQASVTAVVPAAPAAPAAPVAVAAAPAAPAGRSVVGDFLSTVGTLASLSSQPAAAEAEVPEWTLTIYRGETGEDVAVFDETALPEGTTAAERKRLRDRFRQPVLATGPQAPAPAVAAPVQPAAAAPAEPVEPAVPAATPQAGASVPNGLPAFLPWVTTGGQAGL